MTNTFTRFLFITCLFFTVAFLQGQTVYEIDEEFTIADCQGVFVDDGGTVGPHGASGVQEITICSNSTDPNSTHISLNFSQVFISGTLEFFDDAFVNPAALITTLTDDDNGSNPVVSASIANPTGCLTVRFTPNGSNVGWSAFISCIKACQSVVAALIDSDPEVMPADTGTIDLCPGDRVFLTGAGIYAQDGLVYDQDDATSTFEWSFNDGTSALGNEVSKVFNEPGGYTVQLTVTDAEGCPSLNQINQRIRVSPGPIVTFQQNLEDSYCVGETIDLTQSTEFNPDASTNLFIETQPAFNPVSLTFADSIPLPDGDGGSFLSPLEFTGFNPGQTVTSADDIPSVCLNMEHSYGGDLQIELICGDPNGSNQTIIMLPYPNQLGGTFLGDPIDDESQPLVPGEGFEYCFTSDAGLNMNAASDTLDFFNNTLEAGNYLPVESFDGLIGCPLNGEWYIRVRDNLNIDDGWLFSWSLEFEESLYPDRDSFVVGIDSVYWEDRPDLIFYSQDSIVSTPSAAGANTNILTVVDSFGCVWDTTVTANILPFSHPDCYECLPILDQTLQQDTICGQEDIQTTLATLEQIDTAIVWESYEGVDFGQLQFPSLADPLRSSIDVNSINPQLLTNINQIESVCVNLETDFAGDIGLFLRAPNGSTLELSTNNGIGGNNYTNTCFSPAATDPITAGAPPFTGTFQPEGNWNSLLNTPINGQWSLLAYDENGVQVGRFIDWTITFVHTIDLDYSWTPDDGNLSCTDCPNPIIASDQTQTYQLEVVDDYDCTETGEVQITVVDQLPPLMPNCDTPGGPGELIFSWNSSSPSGQYEYFFDAGSGPTAPIVVGDTFVIVSGLAQFQDVTLSVRPFATDVSQLNCISSEYVSITCTYQCLFGANIQNVEDVSCFGFGDGRVTLQLTNSDGLVNFTLNGIPVNITNDTLGGLLADTYQLIATDPTACADTLNFIINEPDMIMADIQETDILCNGDLSGQITINANGGTGSLQYALDGDSFQDNETYAGLGADTYAVRVQDENECFLETVVTLTEPPAIEVLATSQDTRCDDTEDGSIQVEVSGGQPGYTYDWADLPGTNDGEDRALLPAGIYELTITDDNDCEFILQDTVVAPDAIVLDLISVDSVDCFGGGDGAINLSPSGGTGDLTFLWDDPNAQFEPSAVFLTAGTYNVVATDENNCTTTEQYIVEEPDEITLDFNRTDVACRGESTGSAIAVPSGGNSGYNYQWDTNLEEAELTAVPAGVYTLTVTDVKGCIGIDSVQLEQPATSVSASVVQDLQGCFGESLNEATVTADGGAGNYTFEWSNGNTTATATNLPDGVSSVIVTDESGCTFEVDIDLEDLEEITFNLITTLPTCNGFADGAMGINQLTGGAGLTDADYTFEWSNNTTQIVAQNLLGGETYSVVVTDEQGCTGTRELLLADPPPITFEQATVDASCFGFSDGEASITNITGPNTGDFSIMWSDNTGGSTNPTVNDLPAGAYSVLVTDVLGCTQNADLIVRQPTAIAGELTIRDATCFGDADGRIAADISGGTPGYSYDWSVNSTTPTVENLPAGDYQLIVTDANDCEFTVNATVEEPAEVTAEAQPQDVICEGDFTGRILAIGGGGRPPFEYSLDGQFYSRSDQFLGLEAGDYTVYVRDQGGCVRTTTTSVDDGPEFEIDLGVDQNIVFGDSILLEANVNGGVGMLDYFWQGSYDGTLTCDTCLSVLVSPEFEIDYELLVIDENGCEAEDRVRVRVQKIRIVEVPTGFTPNGDTRNDLLLVHGRPGTTVSMFRIFDRWGQVVFEDGDFEVNDPARGWDGSYKGDNLNAGVFIWQLEVIYEDNTTELLEGQTTLIR
ncbi:MAG: proprotein convertase P-domain-containing protein [Bacteroidota bacterium]